VVFFKTNLFLNTLDDTETVKLIENVNFTAIKGSLGLMIPYSYGVNTYLTRQNYTLNCNFDSDCGKGTCINNTCACENGFLGAQCQITNSSLNSSKNLSAKLVENVFASLSNDTLLPNPDYFRPSLMILGNLTTVKELWDSTQIKQISDLVFKIINRNVEQFNDNDRFELVSIFGNLVTIVNFELNMLSVDELVLKDKIEENLELLMQKKLLSLNSLDSERLYDTHNLKIKLLYVDTSNSTALIGLQVNNSYENYPQDLDFYTSIALSGESTDRIKRLNEGNDKVFVKVSSWVHTNPFAFKEGNFLLTSTCNFDFYKSSGTKLIINGLQDPITIRLKKIRALPSDYSIKCSYWDVTTGTWKTDGIYQERTINTNSFISCYTSHLTHFVALAENKTYSNVVDVVQVGKNLI
jgi:hypothetical protein